MAVGRCGSLRMVVSHVMCHVVSCAVNCAQGSMDVRFLAARFEKGKKQVQDIMEKKHRFWTEGLVTGHAELLSYQTNACGDSQPCLASRDIVARTCADFRFQFESWNLVKADGAHHGREPLALQPCPGHLSSRPLLRQELWLVLHPLIFEVQLSWTRASILPSRC